jgi:ribulose-5-phosphate 4-epimerase/fuculose-1-phosphate aldolase
MPETTPGEGYVKFSLQWEREAFDLPKDLFVALNRWRGILYERGYIGVYDDGIGFGNLSMRSDTQTGFFITGSATGSVETLEPRHYAWVRSYDIPNNTLACTGEVKASSESMSHAAIYDRCVSARAVFHIHSSELWASHLNVLPTTDEKAEYGTPEMAFELSRLAEGASSGVIIMGGHEDGIVAFGVTADEAGSLLLDFPTSG